MLYSAGKKGGKNCLSDLAAEFKMNLKPNGARDWIRDYLATYSEEYKKHVVITGDKQNKDGKVDDSHRLASIELYHILELCNAL